MKNKFIFTDIDGVLNSEAFVKDNGSYICIDGKRLLLLKKIVEATGAVIILSSYHRVLLDPPTKYGNYIIEKFGIFGLKILGTTPVIHDDRELEITEYINQHKDVIGQYVILDDTWYNWTANKKHFIHIKDGLTEENVNEAIEILNLNKEI